MVAVSEAIADAPSASEKLRRLFRALTEAGSELFFRGSQTVRHRRRRGAR